METSLPSPTTFDLTGEFGGFVFTAAGKRRMVLRAGGQDHLLKVPRLLRRRVIGTFRDGQVLRGVGTLELDGHRVAEQIAMLKGAKAKRLEIKAVGCLDRCKQAANLDTPWREYRRCTARDARSILAEVAAKLG